MFIKEIYFKASKLIIDNICLTLSTMEMYYMQCIILCIIIESILYLLERRSVMSHYHGRKISTLLATTGSSSNNGDKENGKKAIAFLCKTTLHV